MRAKNFGIAIFVVALLLGINLLGQTENPIGTEIQVAMEPYLPNENLSDDYRCFLLDPEIDQDTFITSYDILPGQSDLVHHVILYVVGADNVSQAQAVDNAEEGPGWTCFGGPGVDGGGSLSSAIGTWIPGLTNTTYPEGTAKLFTGGSQIIMQIHYNLSGAAVISDDISEVILRPTEQDDLMRLRGTTIVSAVEIKCPGEYPEDTNDPCHRSFAVRNVENPVTNDIFHFQCATSPTTYLNRDIGDGSAQEMGCDIELRRTGLALGALGHMHLRGSTLKLELNPDTENARVILDIPNWNFNFQEQFWFDEQIPFTTGDTLRITCSYDNSGPIPGPDGNPLEPRYIIWGEGTTDEMCLGLMNWINN
jgi:hypothetical protein